MKKGYLFILINESLKDDLMHIGVAEKEPDEYASELSDKSKLPSEFIVAYKREVIDTERAEILIKEKINPYISNQSGEMNNNFYCLPLQKAIGILHNISKELSNPIEQIKEEKYIDTLARETEFEKKKRIEKQTESIVSKVLKEHELKDIKEKSVDNNKTITGRVLCSDENCIGVIGKDLRCTECGKHIDISYEKNTAKNGDVIVDNNNANIDQSDNFLGGNHHPWRRFFARTVDLFIPGVLVTFIFSFLFVRIFPNYSVAYIKFLNNQIVAGIFLYLLWLPVEAIFISAFCTTPVKWIFGIKVQKKDGSKLTFLEAFLRTVHLWVKGEGFAIPFVTLFTRIFAYYRLTRTGITLWDAEVGSVVIHKEWGIIRGIFCTLSVIAALLLLSVLNSL